MEVARARPRAAERTATEWEGFEVGLDAGNIGGGVAREPHHCESSVEREGRPWQVRKVQSRTAPEVAHDDARLDGAAQERSTVEKPGLARVAPLACPLLVHRDGVAIHVRSIATLLSEAH